MCWFGTLNGALISAKEEKLVLHDGAAECAPELISLQRVALRRKEVSSVEDPIPHKFKRIAVEIVRTGLRNDVHISRCMYAILCLQSAGFDLEFL